MVTFNNKAYNASITMPRATNLIEIGHSKNMCDGSATANFELLDGELRCNHLFNHIEMYGEELGYLCLFALQKI